MKKALKVLLFPVIFFTSWTSAYALGWFTIPTIISISILIFYLLIRVINGKFSKVNFQINRANIILIIFLVYLTISGLLKFNSKTNNYLLAYYFTIIITYWFNRYLIIKYGSIDFIMNVNLLAIKYVSIFGVAFVVSFLLNIYINPFYGMIYTAIVNVFAYLVLLIGIIGVTYQINIKKLSNVF